MFEAKLSDPVHGKTVAQASTAQEAVEKAFQELAKSWQNVGDPIASFDGAIETLTDDVSEVWYGNNFLLGTVRKLG